MFIPKNPIPVKTNRPASTPEMPAIPTIILSAPVKSLRKVMDACDILGTPIIAPTNTRLANPIPMQGVSLPKFGVVTREGSGK